MINVYDQAVSLKQENLWQTILSQKCKVLLVFLFYGSISAQTFEWAHKSGTSVIATGAAIAADEHGNSYVTGTFFGKCKLLIWREIQVENNWERTRKARANGFTSR